MTFEIMQCFFVNGDIMKADLIDQTESNLLQTLTRVRRLD